MTDRIFLPTTEIVEDTFYTLACDIFADFPDYQMPPLRWLDRGRMDAALTAVHNSYYTSIFEAIAALTYYINKNHPLFDGNKRISVVTLFAVLYYNGYVDEPPISVEDGVAFVENIARSDRETMRATIEAATTWLQQHFVYRPELRQQLTKEGKQ